MYSLIGELIGNPIVSGIIGGCVVNAFNSNHQSKTNKKALICALSAEMTTLIELIETRRKQIDLEKLSLGDIIYFPIFSNYFVVYDAYVGQLGRLEDTTLASNIIETYSNTRGLFDNLADLKNKADVIENLSVKDSKNPMLPALSRNYLDYLKIIVTTYLPPVLLKLKYAKVLLDDSIKQDNEGLTKQISNNLLGFLKSKLSSQ